VPKALTTSAILTGFSSRADGSLGFRGVTPELSAAEKVALIELHNLNVRLLIQPTDTPAEALIEVKGDLDAKTPSVRLRAVLFVWWKQQTEAKKMDGKGFDLFYVEQMNRMIDDIKGQLEPEHA